MTFEEVLTQAIALLQRQGRVAYRALTRQFDLDADYLEDLKEAILYAHPQVVDDGRGLVWTDAAMTTLTPVPPPAMLAPLAALQDIAPQSITLHRETHLLEAERRQLTVMFCDLVDSTPLSAQLDPEDLREVVRAYQQICAEVIQRFDGHIAQLLGDGLLVYFGWPAAHEDDAQRAVRTGLGMLDELDSFNTCLERAKNLRLAIRVGIHTGLVVVGEMGGGGHHEQLALGDTPNIASRIQAVAEPNTVAVSAATYDLVQGYFICQDRGAQALRGVAAPLRVYRVLHESSAQGRLDIAAIRGLTPLVGRESEVTFLRERWEHVTEGQGHVVLVSGEAGIGKSRLVRVLREHIASTPHVRWEWRSSPYHQHTALYPISDFFQRTLSWQPEDAADEKLTKLEQALCSYRLPLEEAVPLFATLLSLSLPAGRYAPLTLSPQRQRQKTLETIVAILLELAERQPVLCVVEDLHWADPTTLALLDLLIEQIPTAPICALLTCRPTFQPPWSQRSYLTQLTLGRLSRPQVAQMVASVAGGKPLPAEVMQSLVEKVDGVPLFVEEMTKATLESGHLTESDGHYELVGPLPSLTIPTTLQDSLMARLDRLVTAKAVAQYAAVIGRQFSYELLQAVTQLDAATLQRELGRLVEAELIYQRGVPPQALYVFKHALITDIAYQALLKGTRQQYHQRIAEVLTSQFPAIGATQPEVVAHHYTEAGLHAPATPYWQQAGQQALQRSANLEAIQHLTQGLALVATLPETPARAQQELALQITLAPALMATAGFAAPAVEQTYARARVLCQQIGDTPQLFPTLRGLCRFYQNQGALHTAGALAEQLLQLTQHAALVPLRLEAHEARGATLFYMGDFPTAWTHLEQGIASIDPGGQRAQTLHGAAPGVRCLALAAATRWCLGYPAQAVRRCREALTLAHELAHAHSRMMAHHWAAALHYRCRAAPAVQVEAEALVSLASAQAFRSWVGYGTCWRGWALAMQGQGKAGLVQMQEGLAALLATGQLNARPLCLVLMAEALGHADQVDQGLRLLAEALTACEASGRGDMLAEAYRLQGELLLHQATPDAAQAEACFQQALTIAQHQRAKSWELRTAMSLSRLWQRQGKRDAARALLAPIYGWFTEGFDTLDLQEAKALLEEL